MERFRIIGTTDSKDAVNMLRPKDFNTKNYRGVMVYATKEQAPVVIRCCEKDTPMPWCVHRATSTVYFFSQREAIDYCKQRGYKLVNGGEDNVDCR